MKDSLNTLEEKLREKVSASGITHFGVADLSPAKDFILRQGDEFLAQYRYGISLGFPLPRGYVDILVEQDSRAALTTYGFLHHHVDHWLDILNVQLCRIIEESGFRALPIPTDELMDWEHALGVFSLKIPPFLAGIGWIGRNNLLITPDLGPRIRLGAILTDAPLPVSSEKPLDDNCGDCTACVEICPAGALTGRIFDPEKKRRDRLDIAKCIAYRREREKEQGAFVCGLCMYICPYGMNQVAEV